MRVLVRVFINIYFSIGDYFRDEAITWAYELLTSPEWFDFPKDKLYMTYYPDDKDSYNRWIEVGVDPSHLIPIEDNFWEIGAGPSGPDTEIFFDRGEAFDPENIGLRLLAEDIENDRYIEIWNIVLSQFNADPAVPRSGWRADTTPTTPTASSATTIQCTAGERCTI